MEILVFVITFLGMLLILLAYDRGDEALFYVGIVITLIAFIVALVSVVIGFGKDVDSISIETKDSIEKLQYHILIKTKQMIMY